MRFNAKLLLAAAVLGCLLGLPARLLAQDAPQQPQVQPETQQSAGDASSGNPAEPSSASSSAAPIAPEDPNVTPATGSNPGSDAGVNAGAPGDNAALNLLNNRIGPNYLIGPEDVLTVDVFDVPELSKFDTQVGNDGTISVPLIGSIKAAGLTQRQLRDELAEDWGQRYLNHPQVSLYIKEFKSRPVSVVGSVSKPGVFFLTGRRTLVEVLAMAGGIAGNGTQAGKEVFVERASGFTEVPPDDGIKQIAADKVSIELKKLLYSEDSTLNIEIKPFDIVSVSRAGIVYLAGAFVKPGGYVLNDKDTITVLEAVAMAQGTSANARTSEARIIRRSSSGATADVSIDLKKILKGKSPDITLAANDILFVPNSAGKAIAKGTASSIIGIVSGLVIYRGL